MGVAERVREVLGDRPFTVKAIDSITAEVLFGPPHDARARQRLHEISAMLRVDGLEVDQVDMRQQTPGLLPGMSNGTRTPPRARPIVPSGPPRLVVRQR